LIFQHYGRKKAQEARTTIQCALCSAVSSLDPHRGLSAFKRKRKKDPTQVRYNCSIHSEQPKFYYCFNCMESICFLCISQKHSTHACEPLEGAYTKSLEDVGDKVVQLNEIRSILSSATEMVSEGRALIHSAAEAQMSLFREQIGALKEKLKQIETEIENGIRRVEASKIADVNRSEKLAGERLQKIDVILQQAQQLLTTGCAISSAKTKDINTKNLETLKYFASVEDIYPDMVHLCNLPPNPWTQNDEGIGIDKHRQHEAFDVIKNKLARFPKLPTEQLLNFLSSRAITYGPASAGAMYSSDEDNEEEYSS